MSPLRIPVKPGVPLATAHVAILGGVRPGVVPLVE